MKESVTSSPSDLRPNLLRALAPYYVGITVVIVVLGVLGGWAGERQVLVLGIVLLQTVGSVILGFVTRSWTDIAALRFTIGLWNMAGSTAIVLITGGFPSPFWLLFMIGAVMSGVMIDPLGGYINLALAGAALIVPRLSVLDMPVTMGVGLRLITLFFVGTVVEKAARRASTEHAKNRAAAEALRESNDQLGLSVARLERKTEEIRVMAEMARMLQASTTRGELVSVVGTYAQQLFPAETGALFLYSASRDDLDVALTWGDFPADAGQRRFAPGDCWALRHGQAYEQDSAHASLHCAHVKDLASPRYLCVPLAAHGDTLGVLHLRFSADQSSTGPATETRTVGEVSTLTNSLAEYVALAYANQQLRDTLRSQAIRDPLTGLFNRRYAEETLVRELRGAARKQIPLSLIFLDLDHFKRINDTYGHDAGDLILQRVGSFLKVRSRGEDVACRYGGEEFLLVLSGASLEIACKRAETLREGIETLGIVYKDQSLPLTASFGVAAYPDSGADHDQLMGAVDAALYKAKNSGRNCVVIAGAVSS